MKKFIPVFVLLAACSQSGKENLLPVYGATVIEENDTTYHTIKDFRLIDQDSVIITNESISDKIYVADFFFTSCPTICPAMKAQMLRVYEKFESNKGFIILSHTIDPKHDTIPLLNDYAARLGVSSESWKFLWGDQDEIYELAEGSYLSIADEDAEAPGGFVHSGAFLLVDKDRRVRGVYDGTVKEQVDVLINDVKKLLKEYNPNKGI
ncbi:MAG: SCO family protein [Ekhidna sp.]|nr:SCO family protein [Ekhidna sp.]